MVHVSQNTDSKTPRIHYINVFGGGAQVPNRGAAAGLLSVLLYVVLSVVRQTWYGFGHAAFWSFVVLNAGFLLENSYELFHKVSTVFE